VTDVAFAGLPLLARPGRVMTPRAASERLVASACDLIGNRPARICDVGTGSGAIALAVARACPQAEVWATDTSRCAVALARTNVRLHGLEQRVFVEHGDLLEPVPGELDLVVANLPYLPLALAPARPDLAGEPPEAVFAPGDGLDPYRRLLAAAPDRLAEDGHLLLQLHRRVHSFSRAVLAAG
jgi:release factor glutamine methyltransferase